MAIEGPCDEVTATQMASRALICISELSVSARVEAVRLLTRRNGRLAAYYLLESPLESNSHGSRDCSAIKRQSDRQLAAAHGRHAILDAGDRRECLLWQLKVAQSMAAG